MVILDFESNHSRLFVFLQVTMTLFAFYDPANVFKNILVLNLLLKVLKKKQIFNAFNLFYLFRFPINFRYPT